MSTFLNKKKNFTSRLVHNIFLLENFASPGSDKQDWQKICNCFAEIIPLTDYKYLSIEGIDFGNFITEEYYLFKIRYLDGINKNFRIFFQDKLYSIKRVINYRERNKMLDIIAYKLSEV